MSLKAKLQNNVFSIINGLVARIAQVEHQLNRLEQKFERDMAVQRNHLVRIKNREEVSDQFLSQGHVYRDLDPHSAWKLFQEQDFDFIFLDVSHSEFRPDLPRPSEALHIPLEDLEARLEELRNKTTPLFIISEDGLRSILACEFLANLGYYNCNNVSGGWAYWPGHLAQPQLRSAESA